MNARRVAAITQRLLHQFRRDRRTLALLFGAPLVILGLLGYLLRGGGDVPKMGVVNLDGGPLGSLVASTLQSSKTVSASSMSQADAETMLRSGDIAGYVLLPSDFTAQVQQHRIVAPQVHLEGSQPGLSQSILQSVSQSFVALAGQAGGVQFTPRITFLYGGPAVPHLDSFRAPVFRPLDSFPVFLVTSAALPPRAGPGQIHGPT